MCDSDWVNFAMADDCIVANLLLRLHHPQPPPSLHLHWTVRQRRSKSVPRHAVKPESTRASPTTPLSWSGATSASGGAVDGCVESSRQSKLAETSRSKVANPKESVTTKKLKRKKNLAELKEEESLLLKERKNLKNQLASLLLTIEKQRATNENLKRLKLDLESRQNSNTTTICEVSWKIVNSSSHFVEAGCHPFNSISPNTATHNTVLDDDSPVHAVSASSKAQEIGNKESKFVLPDLNLPVEEDLSSKAVHCIS